MGIALTQALPESLPKDTKPVLFVITCQNYDSFGGVKVDSLANQAYPKEEEIILKQGCEVYVLAVENGVQINNPFIKDINKKKITIIYLLHVR